LFLPVFKMNFPEILDIALPAEGVFHNLVFLSIRKTYRIQARASVAIHLLPPRQHLASRNFESIRGENGVLLILVQSRHFSATICIFAASFLQSSLRSAHG
jgi:hypothetical protein